MRIAFQELGSDTGAVIARVVAGESVEITVDGQPVARLVPPGRRRPHWTAKASLLDRLMAAQADAGLRDDLCELTGDTDEAGWAAEERRS